jgi:hypothetical protein
MKRLSLIITLLFLLSLTICTYIIIRLVSVADDLTLLAEEEGVTVYVVPSDTMDEVSGLYSLKSVYGLYFPHSKIIYVDQEAPCPFFAFAHEMGHHYAIHCEGDRSESRANEIAYKLILTGVYHK